MASGKHNFKLESGLPLKDMVAGLEKLMPVGSRQFTLVEPDGKDAAGNKKYKSTDLSALQGEPHPAQRLLPPSQPEVHPAPFAVAPRPGCCKRAISARQAVLW